MSVKIGQIASLHNTGRDIALDDWRARGHCHETATRWHGKSQTKLISDRHLARPVTDRCGVLCKMSSAPVGPVRRRTPRQALIANPSPTIGPCSNGSATSAHSLPRSVSTLDAILAGQHSFQERLRTGPEKRCRSTPAQYAIASPAPLETGPV